VLFQARIETDSKSSSKQYSRLQEQKKEKNGLSRYYSTFCPYKLMQKLKNSAQKVKILTELRKKCTAKHLDIMYLNTKYIDLQRKNSTIIRKVDRNNFVTANLTKNKFNSDR
jgi:ABC-type Zn uptake system ZnuABC Zn-binding protein ZnuA